MATTTEILERIASLLLIKLETPKIMVTNKNMTWATFLMMSSRVSMIPEEEFLRLLALLETLRCPIVLLNKLIMRKEEPSSSFKPTQRLANFRLTRMLEEKSKDMKAMLLLWALLVNSNLERVPSWINCLVLDRKDILLILIPKPPLMVFGSGPSPFLSRRTICTYFS